jgi:bifunctional non-homologous end joining protein LigD
VRPRRGAPVATPITWDELDDPETRGDRWTIATVPARLDRVDDPWAGMRRRARSIEGKRRTKLDRFLRDAGEDA